MRAQGQYIKVNDIEMYYEIHGEGPPLVLLHGAYGHIHINWTEHFDMYAEHFTVYAFDARAHGKTLNPSGRLTWDLMVEDALAFIKALGLQRPFISGWSMGGTVALNIAVHHADVTQGMVIGGACHKELDPLPEDEQLIHLKEIGFPAPGEVVIDAFEKNFPQFYMVKDWYGDYYETLIRNISYLAYHRPPSYSEKELQAAELPILLLLGDRDHLTPVETIVELYHLLPDAELAIIPGADHSLVRLNPHRYAQQVIDFLRRQ